MRFRACGRLLDHHTPGGDVVHMTIGEPKHAFPAWVTDVIAENAAGFNQYPNNDGTPELRGAISDWIHRRYGVTADPETQIMALNGTREGLYNAAMALCPEQKNGQKARGADPEPLLPGLHGGDDFCRCRACVCARNSSDRPSAGL